MSDDVTTHDDTEAAAESLFLKLMEGEEGAEKVAEAPEVSDEGDATGEKAGGTQEAPEGSEEAVETLAADDHLVEVEGGRKVPVSELKALLARETEITQRDTQTSEALKRANEEGEKAVTIMGHLIKEAQTEWAKYANVDLALAAQKLPEDAYKQLRADHQAAFQKLSFLTQTGDQFVAQVQANRNAGLTQAITKCDETLAKDTDPLVKGWDAKARKDVADYAVSQGCDPRLATSITDPHLIKVFRKAALYDKGQASVKDKVKPAATSAPKVVLKPGVASGQASTSQTKADEAVARLRKTGSVEDAEAAFLARFG